MRAVLDTCYIRMQPSQTMSLYVTSADNCVEFRNRVFHIHLVAEHQYGATRCGAKVSRPRAIVWMQ